MHRAKPANLVILDLSFFKDDCKIFNVGTFTMSLRILEAKSIFFRRIQRLQNMIRIVLLDKIESLKRPWRPETSFAACHLFL